jgi:hypothetical protein
MIDMKTVRLHGRKAAGRVALVDDEDYELVSQYRWYVWEHSKPGTRDSGPYAITIIKVGGKKTSLRMHVLIMGVKGIDHEDHDGLNNQKRNLRAATMGQNGANMRPQIGRASQYKGVWWSTRTRAWHAEVRRDGKKRRLGRFLSELEAAYAYDAAARELFGEFACPNFPGEPTQAMRDRWQAEREAYAVAIASRDAQNARARGRAVASWWERREPEMRICQECAAEYKSTSSRSFFCSDSCINRNRYRLCGRQKRQAAKAAIPAGSKLLPSARVTEWWAKRVPVVRACQECGKEFFSRGLNPAAYCGKACSNKARRHREREQLEMRECTVCGKEYQPRLRKSLYCSPRCKSTGGSRLRRQRERDKREVRELEGRLF